MEQLNLDIVTLTKDLSLKIVDMTRDPPVEVVLDSTVAYAPSWIYFCNWWRCYSNDELQCEYKNGIMTWHNSLYNDNTV